MFENGRIVSGLIYTVLLLINIVVLEAEQGQGPIYSTKLGDSVSLPCEGATVHSKRIVWYRGQKDERKLLLAKDAYTAPIPVSPSNDGRLSLSETSGSLTIHGVRLDDQDSYTCFYGLRTSNVTLRVTAPGHAPSTVSFMNILVALLGVASFIVVALIFMATWQHIRMCMLEKDEKRLEDEEKMRMKKDSDSCEG